MALVSNFLSALLLVILNIWIASRFYEARFARNWQRVSAVLVTLSACLIFTSSVFRNYNTIYMLPILLFTYSIILIDWLEKRIPNRITLILAVLQSLSILIRAFSEKSLAPLSAIYLGLGAFAIFLILNLVSRSQIGMGDVKLSYSLAVGIGSNSPYSMYWASLLAFSMAGIFALGLLLSRKASLHSSFAFGPFMILGTWLSLLVYQVQ